MEQNEQGNDQRIELTCSFFTIALENGRVKNEKISISLPMTESEIDELFETHEASITNGSIFFHDLKWTDEPYFFDGTEMGYLRVKELHEMNRFTQRLSEMSAAQKIKLRGLYENDCKALYFSYEDRPYNPTIAKGINLTFNIDNIEFIPSISKAKELGKHCVENNLIKELEVIPTELRKYLNYDYIGEKYCTEHNGVFLQNAFVYNIPQTDQLRVVYPEMESGQDEESNTIGYGGQSF